jgi:hypothetical protein
MQRSKGRLRDNFFLHNANFGVERLKGGGIDTAPGRVEAELVGGDAPESAIVALEAGRVEDARIGAERTVKQLLDQQLANGSWNESVNETARALWLLAALDRAFKLLGVGRAACAALGWLGSRKNQPARAFDRCVPASHQVGLCPHFLTGLYAPGDGDRDPAQMPGGAQVVGPDNSAVAVSAAALRSALVWGLQGTDGFLQVEGMRRIVSLWANDRIDHLLGPSAAAEAVLALLYAPVQPATVTAIADALARIVRTQRADGTWHQVEPVHFTEVLLAGSSLGYRVEESDRAIARAASLLSSGVPEGYRTADLGPARLLTIWRALRYGLAPPAQHAELTAQTTETRSWR